MIPYYLDTFEERLAKLIEDNPSIPHDILVRERVYQDHLIPFFFEQGNKDKLTELWYSCNETSWSKDFPGERIKVCYGANQMIRVRPGTLENLLSEYKNIYGESHPIHAKIYAQLEHM